MPRGLEKRTKALKHFLTDIYAEWGMMRAGMISKVRVSADEFYMLSDDARTASGIYNSGYYERTYRAEHKYGTPVLDLTLT